MEVGEEDLVVAEQPVLLGNGLLHLEDQLGVGPDLVSRAGDACPDRLVGTVPKRAPLPRPRLDEDVVTTLEQLTRACRRERDAVLVGLDLAGDADLHGGGTIAADREN